MGVDKLRSRLDQIGQELSPPPTRETTSLAHLVHVLFPEGLPAVVLEPVAHAEPVVVKPVAEIAEPEEPKVTIPDPKKEPDLLPFQIFNR